MLEFPDWLSEFTKLSLVGLFGYLLRRVHRPW
jgi:hypothetical protein